ISGPGTTPTTNADIFISGVLAATTGSISIDAAHQISISANQIAGTDITFHDSALLTNDVGLTAGRDVTFVGAVNDDGSLPTSSNLTITAGRDIAFYGNIG